MIEPPTGVAVHQFTHDAMACSFGLALVIEDEGRARRFARAAFDELDRLERILSQFVPHSDIAHINALALGDSHVVEPETLECLQLASALKTETGGAFDIAFETATTGDESESPLVFDPDRHAVSIQHDPVRLDLGGLGKGYALDRVADLLLEWQIPAARIHSGQSTVFTLGCPTEEQSWPIALRDPRDENRVIQKLNLCGGALAGSGQKLHGDHIIDPRTDKPVPAGRAAWASAPSAAVADGLSTAFMVMSANEIEALCRRRQDVIAYVFESSDTGEATLRAHPDPPIS